MLENKKDNKPESLNEENKIKELSEEELEQVTGGIQIRGGEFLDLKIGGLHDKSLETQLTSAEDKLTGAARGVNIVT